VPTLDTASTPTGTFAILGKFVTATMVSGSVSSLIHAEVQYTQNIGGPYALHGAYWHDVFGERKSGGCVNLSPIDSQRIFEWTEPQLPEGWHGMRSITSGHDFGARTLVSIHE
jgi:lipoprotein-anchoring transpeptidase ErfK/SrfK